MRKLLAGLLVLVVLVGSVPVLLLATGTIDSTSLRMLLNVATGLGGPAADADTVATRYAVPEGFSLGLYAADLPRARFLAVSPQGDLLVTRPHAGDVVLLRRDSNGDGQADGRSTLLEGLNRPHGIDLHEGWLYIAESDRIGRAPFDAAAGALAGSYETVVEGFTDNGNHWSKTLRFGPDGAMYLAQGSTCNICEEEDPRRATLMRFAADGSGETIYATGLRNSVGFDWAPWSGELYATDNGRDLLGDDFPPCELNRIEQDSFYGWPYFNGDNLPDPDMGPDPRAAERTPVPPEHDFRAHNAPLGIAFLDATRLPPSFARSALVALHGSWNRSEPDGYKVVSLHWGADGIEERDFLTGFNLDGDIVGRPADVIQGPDGAIYVSDDYAGAIYRIAPGDGVAGAGTLAALPARREASEPPQAPPWLADADIPAMAAAGDALYRQYGCAECHEGGENPLRPDDLAARLGHVGIIDTLIAPQSPMPIYPLSESERREIAVFLLTPPAD